MPGPKTPPELTIVKAPSTPPQPKTESDAAQGLKGKAGSINSMPFVFTDNPLAYFKPKDQVADKHRLVQCRFPACIKSVKDSGGWSFCKYHNNQMWNDQELWVKVKEDIDGRDIGADEMTVDMLRPRPTGTEDEWYCRWPNCWIQVAANKGKWAFCRAHKSALPDDVWHAINKGMDKDTDKETGRCCAEPLRGS